MKIVIKIASVLLVSCLLLVYTATEVQGEIEEGQIQIEVHHLLIREVEAGLEVREIIHLENRGETLEPGTLRISLPFSYSTLVINSGIETEDHLEIDESGFSFMVPIETGTMEMDFLYTLVPHNNSFVLDKDIKYPTEQLNFLLTQNLEMAGDKVVFAGEMTMDELIVNNYYWDEPLPGEEFITTISRKEAGGVGVGDSPAIENEYSTSNFHSPALIRFWNRSPFSGFNPHLFFLVVIVGTAVIVTWTVRNWRRGQIKEDSTETQDIVKQELVVRERVLLRKLAEAKKQQQSGEMDQDTFDKLNSAYREKLKKVKIELKQLDQ